MTNEEIVRTACRVIWSEGDTSRIPEFYAPEFRADYPMTDWGTGLAGIENLVTQIRGGFPDYRERIDELIDAGENIIVRLTIEATHTGTMLNLAPTGKRVAFSDVTICRVRSGKIVEQRGLTDYLSLYLQLGIVEMPSAGAKTS